MYQQSYDPAGNVLLSTLAAAIPILVLLYFIALHRHRDAQGNVHLGISAPFAAFYGVIAAFAGVVLGCTVNARCVAAPGETSNGVLVMPASPVAAAVRV